MADCTSTRYCDFYLKQAGGSMGYFAGSPHTHGAGLGGIFSSLARTITPFIKTVAKSGLKSAKRHAVKSGLAFANDVLSGRSLKESAKRRGTQALKGLSTDVFSTATASGSRGRVSKKKKKTKKPAKRRKIDIIEAY